MRSLADRPRNYPFPSAQWIPDGEHRAFVNGFVAEKFIVSPTTSPDAVNALAEPVRAELRVAVAEFYGRQEAYTRLVRKSGVSGDEALRTVLSEWAQEHMERIESNGGRRDGLGLLGLLKGFASMAEVAGPVLRDHPARWLLEQLTVGAGITLAAALGWGRDQLLIGALEHSVKQSQLIGAVKADIDANPIASGYPREHLRHGLDHLEAGDYVHAWPPLIVGLEGALRDAAFAAGQLTEFGRMGDKRPSVEGVVDLLPLSPELVVFVKKFVYGGEGNEFRHCSKREGARRQCLLLLVAVAGWLDASRPGNALPVLREAMDAALADTDVHVSSSML